MNNYTPLQNFGFADQAAAGLSSGNFDLEENMAEGSGEGRVGLDEAGVEEVRKIMYVLEYPKERETKKLIDRAIERCTFDQARLIRHNRILAKNGIAPDGKLKFS